MENSFEHVAFSPSVIVSRAEFADFCLHREAVLRRVLVTRFQAAQDFHPLPVGSPELERTRLEPVAILDEHHLPVSEGLDALGRNRERNGGFLTYELHRDEQPRSPL